jgi:hypothetical protein
MGRQGDLERVSYETPVGSLIAETRLRNGTRATCLSFPL